MLTFVIVLDMTLHQSGASSIIPGSDPQGMTTLGTIPVAVVELERIAYWQ